MIPFDVEGTDASRDGECSIELWRSVLGAAGAGDWFFRQGDGRDVAMPDGVMRVLVEEEPAVECGGPRSQRAAWTRWAQRRAWAWRQLGALLDGEDRAHILGHEHDLRMWLLLRRLGRAPAVAGQRRRTGRNGGHRKRAAGPEIGEREFMRLCDWARTRVGVIDGAGWDGTPAEFGFELARQWAAWADTLCDLDAARGARELAGTARLAAYGLVFGGAVAAA